MAATAAATTSSLLARRLLLTRRFLSSPLRPFSTTGSSSSSSSSSYSDDSHAGSDVGPDPEQQPPAGQDQQDPVRPRARDNRPLENGLDPGIYKAIMVGKVGQEPIQKRLRSGRTVVLFSLGTGGIRNNRRPLDREEPHQYAERCSVQWHRVCIYPDRLGSLALKHVKTGTVLYLEGNLETKVFSDPITGLVRRIREIAVRSNALSSSGKAMLLLDGGKRGCEDYDTDRSRLLFLGNDLNAPKLGEAKGVGYF